MGINFMKLIFEESGFFKELRWRAPLNEPSCRRLITSSDF